MACHHWTAAEDAIVADGRASGRQWNDIAQELGLTESGCRRRFKFLQSDAAMGAPKEGFSDSVTENNRIITLVSATVRTLGDALAAAEVDRKKWDVERHVINKWDQGAKIGVAGRENIAVTELWQVKIWLKPRLSEVTAVDELLAEMAAHKIKLPKFRRIGRRPAKHPRLALEVSIMDPHLGMRCFKPQSDHTWSMDECEQMFMATAENLLAGAAAYAPYERIVVPIGNDYLHCDNVFHTTTGGTPQPEADSIHEAFVRGEKLMLWYIERLRQVGPVHVVEIPGNHSRMMDFCMGRLVRAFYAGAGLLDKTVTVDVSAIPYKFWRFGVNLIGFEHGHSVPAIRLASLMANETRLNGWQEARYCEWHLGDQHRKASSVPSCFEEQGVSVEYLPGLTPPNEWHRLKAFNWQKRGGMAFVYDHDRGPVRRLQVNFDNYTGRHMGVAA